MLYPPNHGSEAWYRERIPIRNAQNRVVAWVANRTKKKPSPEIVQLVHLLAEAPELLAAIVAAQRCDSTDYNATARLQRAIERATEKGI